MPLALEIGIAFTWRFLDVLVYFRLLNQKLTYRFAPATHILTFGICYALAFGPLINANFFPELYLKPVWQLLFFVCLFFMYKDSFMEKIRWISVAFFLIFTVELLLTPIIMLTTGLELQAVSGNLYVITWGSSIARILSLLIAEYIIHTKKAFFSVFIKDYSLIIVVDALYAFILMNFFYFRRVHMTTETAIVISIVVISIITILSIALLRKITKKSEEILTANLKLQQMEMEYKQNQDMTLVVEDLRSLRHDMNNHMSVLQGLLSMESYDDAKEYLADITHELSTANNFVFTENKVLSVLLNSKISKARQAGITVDTEILTVKTPFTDHDLCTVLGNILENAIEAATHHEHPYINLSIRREDCSFLVICKNTYTTKPLFEKGLPLTIKQDKTLHGIGVKNISSVVAAHKGTVTFEAEELFVVTLRIPLNE